MKKYVVLAFLTLFFSQKSSCAAVAGAVALPLAQAGVGILSNLFGGEEGGAGGGMPSLGLNLNFENMKQNQKCYTNMNIVVNGQAQINTGSCDNTANINKTAGGKFGELATFNLNSKSPITGLITFDKKNEVKSVQVAVPAVNDWTYLTFNAQDSTIPLIAKKNLALIFKTIKVDEKIVENEYPILKKDDIGRLLLRVYGRLDPQRSNNATQIFAIPIDRADVGKKFVTFVQSTGDIAVAFGNEKALNAEKPLDRWIINVIELDKVVEGKR